MQLDPAGLDRAATYRLLISVIVPRPIAWVGTLDAAGSDNLAPFSYFMGVSSASPLLAFSCSRGRAGALKHTARNILANGEFTIAIPEEDLLHPMHATGANHEGSEFDAVGLERAPSVRIRPPRVARARVALECRLHHALDLEATHLFVGEVVYAHVDDALWKDGQVDITLFRPVARLGGDHYASLGDVLTVPRTRV